VPPAGLSWLYGLATRTRLHLSNRIGQLWAISSLPKKKSMKILSRSFAFGPIPGTWLRDFMGHGRPLGAPLPSDPPSASECRPFAHSHSFSGHRLGAKRQRFPFRYSLHGSKVASFLGILVFIIYPYLHLYINFLFLHSILPPRGLMFVIVIKRMYSDLGRHCMHSRHKPRGCFSWLPNPFC